MIFRNCVCNYCYANIISEIIVYTPHIRVIYVTTLEYCYISINII